MKNITIIPTSHISEQSIKKIREVISEKRPDCVAVELDMTRFEAMKNNQNDSSWNMLTNMGLPTFLIFYLLKYMQKKLGGMVGIVPGSDMMTAVEAAKEAKTNVAFIDMDIKNTAYKFKTDIPLGEKLNMIKYIISAGLFISVGKYIPFWKKGDAIDLRNVPEKDIIKTAMKVFSEKFPNLYRILLTERNDFMAKNILSLLSRFDDIVVVIGAGHEEGIRKLLDEKINKIKEENEKRDSIG